MKNISSIIFPNKKVTILIVSLFIIGIISGALFLTVINSNDKMTIINSLQDYFKLIKDGNYKNYLANTLYINYIYIILIFILGLSFLGIILNLFIVYIKGFITGFSIASFIYVYKIKGLLSSLIYLVPTEIINIIIIISLTIYSILFSFNLIKLIFKYNNKTLINFKQFIVVFLFSSIFTFLNSFLESVYLPNIIKIFINLFV